MTIAEAAREALRRSGKPMTVDEIYQIIVVDQLAEFIATQPRGVLRNQIRRHCEGIYHCSPSKDKYFNQVDDGRYGLGAMDIHLRLSCSPMALI